MKPTKPTHNTQTRRAPSDLTVPQRYIRTAIRSAGGVLALAILAGIILLAARHHKPILPRLDPSLVDGAKAMAHIRELIALGRRDAGTDGAQKAAALIKAKLDQLGIEATIDEFEDSTPKGPALFRNVIGSIPGTGKRWIVLGSHFDTKSGIPAPFQGANDSGSSTGLLLELARLLKASPPLPFNITLAFFDGEECSQEYGPTDGLHGSRRLVKVMDTEERLAFTRAVIVLDMIGDRDLSVMIPANGSSFLATTAFKSAKAQNVREKFVLSRSSILDDHQSFLDVGVPAINLIDFAYGTATDLNCYWHTPQDTIDKLSPESLVTVGGVVLEMINTLIEQEEQTQRLFGE